ncbi:multiple epidermal growth factor-like domains protein 10 [Patella vulgata]|uniref:multiple epidermal growth factor-like domains protein 10 n=1 Tax=Patella vulgata TaxID=6465 RepID=UPI0024A957EB|nr:multiple epidermal growth factor-like domains protein 10 [Patella vulgata]
MLAFLFCLFSGWRRLRGFEIKTSSSGQCNQAGPQSSTSCYKDRTSTTQSVYTVTGCNQPSSASFSGRTVYVSTPNKPLTLCEVEIFADQARCNTGYYSISRSTCQPCNKCYNNTCDPTTGVCTGDCKTGFYGTKCQQNCSDGCLNNRCSKSDGRCNDCKPDTVGQYCNRTCGAECQPRSDQTTTTCDRNGRCTNCMVGRHGDKCDMSCNTGCDGRCDRNDGKCTSCIKGKTGDRCDINCNDNCTSCNQGSADSCTECKDGRWGSSCNKLCNTNCKPVVGTTVGKCDQMTRTCINGCLPGKIGLNCTSDCEAGRYGENCTSKCGNCVDETPCDIITGSCGLVGCVDGFQGPTCKDVQTPQEPDDYTTIIAAVVSAVVAIIIASVVIFLVLKCRRRQKSRESDQVLANDIPMKAKTDASRPSEKQLKVEEKPIESGNTYVNPLGSSNKEEVGERSTQVYVNVDEPSEPSTRVKLTNLLPYIKSRKKEKTFKTEYQTLPSGLCSAYDYCMNAVNKPKNRYKNICAFDHSRVKLDIENDDPNSDYINACYITVSY